MVYMLITIELALTCKYLIVHWVSFGYTDEDCSLTTLNRSSIITVHVC